MRSDFSRLVRGCLLALVVLAPACARVPAVPVSAPAAGDLRPVARPGSAAEAPAAAGTAEALDTTTPEQRAAAGASPSAEAATLGMTVVSLGDPARAGFWLETPLVSVPARGRVLDPASGKAVAVELIPIDGPPTAGSRLSLAAMRLLGLALTDLTEVMVFAG